MMKRIRILFQGTWKFAGGPTYAGLVYLSILPAFPLHRMTLSFCKQLHTRTKTYRLAATRGLQTDVTPLDFSQISRMIQQL